MPIEFYQDGDEIRIRQSFISPTVYLDHWAIRMFSDDLVLQNRFVNIIKKKGGTLLLSNFSCSEFAVASDARHALDAEIFINRLLPNVFLTDFALDKVLQQEIAEPDNLKRFWPSADLPQLKFFAERAYKGSKEFTTLQGFFSLAHLHDTEINSAKSDYVAMIKKNILELKLNQSYIAKARSTQPNNKRPRTLIIMGELMRGFILDNAAPILENDIIDMTHAIMSVNCCDYVLLDGAWLSRIENMRHRISKTGSNMSIAKCFSRKKNGIESFLRDLEEFSHLN